MVLLLRVASRGHGYVPSISPEKLPSVRILSAISGWAMDQTPSGDNEAGTLIRNAVRNTFDGKTVADFLENKKADMKTGVVYTPDYWADWAVSRYGISDKWLDGAVILDPGCGTGALLEAVVRGALKRGHKIEPHNLAGLIGIDRDSAALRLFRQRMIDRYGLVMPTRNLICGDYLSGNPKPKADIVFGNPPWISFADLSQNGEKLPETAFPRIRAGAAERFTAPRRFPDRYRRALCGNSTYSGPEKPRYRLFFPSSLTFSKRRCSPGIPDHENPGEHLSFGIGNT